MQLILGICWTMLMAGPTGRSAAAGPFDYDQKMPLELSVTKLKEDDFSISYSFSFIGKKSKVPGLFIVPKNVKKPPVALALHGLGGNKSFGQSIAIGLIPSGYAVLALDAPGHGERRDDKTPLVPTDTKRFVADLIEAIVDYRRAMDALKTRVDVDSNRIVLVGVSMGGIMGTLVAGSDARVRAAALIVPGGGWKTIMDKSQLPMLKPLRDAIDKVPPNSKEAEELNSVDPVNWIGKIAPRPILIVRGDADTIVPPEATDLLEKNAKAPTTVIVYKGGHLTPAGEFPKIYDWLLKNTPKS